MKIRLIQVGKNKDTYLEEGVNEFLKRLGPFAKVEIVTLKEISPSKTFSATKCKQEEGAQIMKNINDGNYVVALDEKGKLFGSVEFSQLLKTHADMGREITFIIGGAFGLDDSVKERADLMLSLSKMTFTHQMIRLFLLEQIYRGSCIIRGKEYHIA